MPVHHAYLRHSLSSLSLLCESSITDFALSGFTVDLMMPSTGQRWLMSDKALKQSEVNAI